MHVETAGPMARVGLLALLVIVYPGCRSEPSPAERAEIARLEVRLQELQEIERNLAKFEKAYEYRRERLAELSRYQPLKTGEMSRVVGTVKDAAMEILRKDEESTLIRLTGKGDAAEPLTLVEQLEESGSFVIHRLIKGRTKVLVDAKGAKQPAADLFDSTDGWEITLLVEYEPPRKNDPAPHATSSVREDVTERIAELESELKRIEARLPAWVNEYREVEERLVRAIRARDRDTGAQRERIERIYRKCFQGDAPPLSHGVVADMYIRPDVTGYLREGRGEKDLAGALRPEFEIKELSRNGSRVAFDLEPAGKYRRSLRSDPLR
jgi:hypothetical protein